MIKKRLIDENTREKFNTLTPINPKFKKDWLAMFQESLHIIAMDKELNGYALRVLLELMSKLNFENYICISQSEIGKNIGIAQPNVNTAISLLVEKQIIFKQNGVGTAKAYKLNPNIGWKGDVAKFEKEKKKYPKINQQKTIPELINELDQYRNKKNKPDHD
jgi:threonyl-tRNA synthetase